MMRRLLFLATHREPLTDRDADLIAGFVAGFMLALTPLAAVVLWAWG